MTDTRYKFWLDALAGKNPPAINEQAECGFYRMRRGTTWVPVAVYPTGAVLGFKFGREVVHPNMGVENWPRYCSNPITEAVYRAVAENGADWPDADPVVAAMVAKVTPQQIAGKINSGQKLSPEEDARLEQSFEEHAATVKAFDPTAEFREEIQTALGGVGVYAKIESDEVDVRALSLRNMLNELAANADKAREAEKAPHLKASRDIDAKWQPLVKSARDGAGKVKAARDDWANAKLEAQRQAAQRARDAEEQHRKETEAAAAANKPAPPPPVAPPSNLPPVSTQVRPTYGKAAATGTKMVVESVDYDKFFAALKLRPEWPTVKAQFDEWAQKLANKGIIPDGVIAAERANTR